MTTETQLTLPPMADLTGAWQKTLPLPIDAAGFVSPTLKSWDSAAYLTGDAASSQTQTAALTLPDLGEAVLGEPSFIGVTSVNYTDYTTSTRTIDLPTGILADDLIIVMSGFWTDVAGSGGAPPLPTGAGGNWFNRFSNKDSGTYPPRMTLDYKIAAGSESGATVTVVFPGNPHPVTMAAFVYRFIDTDDPFDVADPSPAYGSWSNPDPPSITTVTDGAVVLALNVTQAQNPVLGLAPPTNYTERHDAQQTYASRRGLAIASRTISTAGAENPAIFTPSSNIELWNARTIALRPAVVAPDRTLVVLASSADETASAALLGSDCSLDGVDEVQIISSSLGAGTFTITLDGQTTSALNWNASAADVESALEALSNVSVGDVRCDGGPLDGASAVINVEFDNGWGNQDVPLMTTNSGSVTVAEGLKGYSAENFVYEGDINVPRSGGSMEPQIFAWSLTPTAGYLAGRTITFDVSDHGTLKSWAAVLLVWADLDTANPLETFGTEVTGTGSVTDIGPITPATQGSRVLALIAKALSAGNYSVASGVSTPARTVSSGAALADSMSLSAFTTPPTAAAVFDLGTSSWSSSELFASGVVSLKPATPPSVGLDLYQVIDTETVDDWLEIASSAGSLEEIIEVDTSGLPSDAYVVALSIEFAHDADAAHRLLALPVGITAGGVPTVASPLSSGHQAVPLGSTIEVTTERFSDFPDGSEPNDYPRYGIALRSVASQPNLGSHRVFWARLVVHYLAGGPVVSNVVGPANAGDPITWDYSSASGFAQTHYRVLIMSGLSADPLTATPAPNPWEPSAGEIIYDSGRVASSAKTLTLTDFPLHRDNMTVAVKAFASANGTLIESSWAQANFSISGAAPGSPSINTAPFLEESSGVVRMSVDTPAAISRAWVCRSDDGGTTWALADTNPFTVSASASDQQLYDDSCPLESGRYFRVMVDNGPMSETGPQVNMIGGGGLDATPSYWYLQKQGDPDSNIQLEVRSVEIDRPRQVVVADRPNGAIVASSQLLGDRLVLTVRVRDATTRLALENLLSQTTHLRLTDIWGKAWKVRPLTDDGWSPQRWQSLSTETTALRDAHEAQLEFIEVVGS